MYSFVTGREKRKYYIYLILFITMGLLASYGLLFYQNKIPIESPSFFPVVKKRIFLIINIIIVVVCQTIPTIAFQTVTNNKMISPSLLGMESFYSFFNTLLIFFGGGLIFLKTDSVFFFFLKLILMVLFSSFILMPALLKSSRDIQLVLLLGITIGIALRTISSFLRNLLTPSEFDILQAKSFGSVSNSNPDYLPLSIILVIIITILFFRLNKKLNVIALGINYSKTVGINYKFNLAYILFLVSFDVAISTTLVGPFTFLGFLVALLTYHFTPTYDHRYLFIMSLAIGFFILSCSYFFMYHIFRAQGVVSIIIEIFGGVAFLMILFKKRKL